MKYLLMIMMCVATAFGMAAPSKDGPKKDKVVKALPVPLQTIPNLKEVQTPQITIENILMWVPVDSLLTTYKTYTSGPTTRVLYLEVNKPIPQTSASDMLLAFIQSDYTLNHSNPKLQKYLVIVMTKKGEIVLWGYGLTSQMQLVWEKIPDDMAVKKPNKEEKTDGDDDN